MGPESNAPIAVAVCGCESWLIQVTNVPSVTVTLPGLKALLLMTIVTSPD